MKLRIVYGCIYAIYGLMAGLIASLVLFGIIAGVLWIFVFGDNPWPDAAYKILGAVHLLSFGAIFLTSIVLGVNRGIRLEAEENQEEVFKKAVNRLIVGIVVAGIFLLVISYIGLRREDGKGEREQIRAQIAQIMENHREIETINVFQDEKGINIAAVIPGSAEGLFELSLDLVSNGYVKDELISYSNEVELTLKKQEFLHYIPFDKLAAEYRKKLLNYIPFFEKEFQIDEILELKVGLKIKDNEAFDRELIESFEFPLSERVAMLRFNFSCYKETCSVIQSDPASSSGLKEN